MSRRARFSLVFAPETLNHLDAIEHKYHRLIQQTIDTQLCYTPDKATRNRKALEQPAAGETTWELRFGPDNRFRVFYEVDMPDHTVRILAIGVKERNRLVIGGKEFKP